jgi:hypothetical protein
LGRHGTFGRVDGQAQTVDLEPLDVVRPEASDDATGEDLLIGVQDECAKRIAAIFESILGDSVKYVILFRRHRTEDHRDQGRNVGRIASLSPEHHPNATHRRSTNLVIVGRDVGEDMTSPTFPR